MRTIGFLDRFFKPQVENRTTGQMFSSWFGLSGSGKIVNERTSMQTSAVYACVKVLAEAMASLPLHVYRPGAEGGREKALDHPLYKLLHDEPNPEMTSFIFRETLMSHLVMWGNAYAQIIRNGRGEPVALYPLFPNKMTVGRWPKKEGDPNSGRIYYQYRYDAEENPKEEAKFAILFADEILHIPGLGFDGLVGYSPIAMMRNAVGLSIAAEEYGSSYFKNGAQPGGVLEHPGLVKDPQRLREEWSNRFGGSGNSGKIAVLEEGMKYTPIQSNPADSQFIETRKFQINEIARIFRIPPHMIGDLEKASFSNIEQQSIEFVKYTLEPWVVRWEQSLKRSLMTPEEKTRLNIHFNLEGLMRGEYATRMAGYATARQNGWMSANDIRSLENLDRIPADQGGDLYLINGNMVPINKAGFFAGNQEGGE